MTHDEFHIGLEFWCSKKQWRCTDVGTRVVVAIRIDSVMMGWKDDDGLHSREMTRAEAEEMNWFSGPPYGVVDRVFDEDDLEICVLTLESQSE